MNKKQLTDLLGKNPKTKEIFEQLSPSHKKEYLDWINSAKKENTKLIRTEKTIRMLIEKNKRKK